MPWQKMIFRNDRVWVLVGEDGRPILDRDGRAEMKYRESDTKTYRPGPANLTPDSAAGGTHEAGAGPGAGASTGGARPLTTTAPARPRVARARAHTGGAHAHDGDALQIWTDGACSGNPGPMGIGVVVIDGKEREERGEFLGHGTNNIAELVAIERGLAIATPRVAATPERRVRVFSDSSYAIGLLEKGWKPKANQELVARLRRKLAAFPASVEFVKVAGHAGVPENERCDELGRRAIERAR